MPTLATILDWGTTKGTWLLSEFRKGSRARAAVLILGIGITGFLAASLIAGLVNGLIRAAITIGGRIDHTARQLMGHKITQVVTGPITDYITTHAAGLPVPAPTLVATWALSGLILLTAAFLGMVGARIAWPLYGAAMAWFGAAELHRPISAGAVLLAVSLFSLLAYRRVDPGPLVVVNNPAAVESDPRPASGPTPVAVTPIPIRPNS